MKVTVVLQYYNSQTLCTVFKKFVIAKQKTKQMNVSKQCTRIYWESKYK